MTTRKPTLSRTPAYVSREIGAAELSISISTWDSWVRSGKLPQPAPGFPSSTPRWRWADVDWWLSGRSEVGKDADNEALASGSVEPMRQKPRYRNRNSFDELFRYHCDNSVPMDQRVRDVQEFGRLCRDDFVRTLPEKPLGKREIVGLELLKNAGAEGFRSGDVKGIGDDTMDRLEIRGFAHPMAEEPGLAPRYQITPAGLAAWRRIEQNVE